MQSYPMEKQKMIVAATVHLHNFIRENHSKDKDFSKCDQIRIMCPLYLESIESIMVRTEMIHQLQNLMIEI